MTTETETLARAQTPHGELALLRRPAAAPGAEPVIELRANGGFVMDSAETSSERALATLALAEAPHRRRVLVGGLGLGFTAREVLAHPHVERCHVVEIEPTLVDWLEADLVPGGARLMDDPRLHIEVADVVTSMAEQARDQPGSWDAILLDVDNGPDQLVHEANTGLYSPVLLQKAARCLAVGGVLAVWSAEPAADLAARMTTDVGPTSTHRCPVRLGDRAEDYWVLLAQVTAESPGAWSAAQPG